MVKSKVIAVNTYLDLEDNVSKFLKGIKGSNIISVSHSSHVRFDNVVYTALIVYHD